MAIDLRLPCRKLSLAYGQREDRSIPWNHTSAPDLYMALKGKNGTAQGSELTMRIFQGSQIMESVDIGAYADEALKMQFNAEQAGIKLQQGDLSIFILTKAPLLAIRYVLEGKPRRVQLNMRNVDDCHHVINILRQRGMTILDQIPQSQPLGTSRSIASAQGFRSAPMSSHASKQQLSYPDLTGESSILSAGIASTAAPASHEHNLQTGLPTKDASTAQFLALDESAAPTFAVPGRPNTSQMYRSRTMLSKSHLTPFTKEEDLVSRASQPESTRDGAAVVTQEQRKSDESRYYDPERLRTAITQSGSRPGSSTLTLPPLPRPNPIQERVGSRSSTLQASSTLQTPLAAQSTSSPLRRDAKSDEEAAEVRYHAPNKLAPGSANERPCSMHEPRHHRQPLANLSCNNSEVLHLNSSADAPYEIVSSPVTSRGPRTSDVERHSVAKHVDDMHLNQGRLESYASESLDNRHAAFEEFMMANIENPAFTTLCEDVENYWRRIVLHL